MIVMFFGFVFDLVPEVDWDFCSRRVFLSWLRVSWSSLHSPHPTSETSVQSRVLVPPQNASEQSCSSKPLHHALQSPHYVLRLQREDPSFLPQLRVSCNLLGPFGHVHLFPSVWPLPLYFQTPRYDPIFQPRQSHDSVWYFSPVRGQFEISFRLPESGKCLMFLAMPRSWVCSNVVGISFKGYRRNTGGHSDVWLPNDGIVDDEKENGLNNGGAVMFVLKHKTAITAPEKAQTSDNYCSATGRYWTELRIEILAHCCAAIWHFRAKKVANARNLTVTKILFIMAAVIWSSTQSLLHAVICYTS